MRGAGGGSYAAIHAAQQQQVVQQAHHDRATTPFEHKLLQVRGLVYWARASRCKDVQRPRLRLWTGRIWPIGGTDTVSLTPLFVLAPLLLLLQASRGTYNPLTHEYKDAPEVDYVQRKQKEFQRL